MYVYLRITATRNIACGEYIPSFFICIAVPTITVIISNAKKVPIICAINNCRIYDKAFKETLRHLLLPELPEYLIYNENNK